MDDDIPGKRCRTCGEWKPLTEFSEGRHRCKACRAEQKREAYKASPQRYRDAANERGRKWREANLEEYRARKRAAAKRFYHSNPGYRERQKQRWAELRDQVLDHYGRTCACCGSSDQLSIDHPNGDGAAHRTELFGNRNAAGRLTYEWLVSQGFPGGFQVLCLPCNQSKGSGPACLLHNPRPHCQSCSCYSLLPASERQCVIVELAERRVIQDQETAVLRGIL